MNTIDIRLARLAQNGDQEAFAELIERYKDKIYRLGYRMLGNQQEAEDITQETFLRVHMNLEKYDGKHKFSTWIFRIGTNLCIDRMRKKRLAAYSLDAQIGDEEGTDGYSFVQSKDDSPENQVILSESQQRVRRIIDDLPEKYKSVIILFYLHDFSIKEISDVVEMPVATVKTRLHRGRELLRKKLKKDNLLS